MPWRLLRALFLLLLLLTGGAAHLVPPVHAQAPEPSIPGYLTKRWTTADGLPYNGINDLLQTRDGYIWIATNNGGLARFDGVTFRTFDVMNTPELYSNGVTALFEAADGTLWIGTTDGLARYRDGVFTHEPLDPADWEHRYIVDIASDPSDRLWVATSDDIVRRDGDRWTRLPTGPVGVTRIWPDRDGVTWIGTSAGLLEMRDGEIVRSIGTKDGLPALAIGALHRDRLGRLWVGTSNGLAHLGSDGVSIAPAPSALSQARVTRLFEDSSGTLWIGGLGRAFAWAPDGTLAELPTAEGSTSGFVSSITEDREGHLWLGVFEGPGGLIRLGRERVTVLAQGQGLPCDNVGAITQSPDGTVWVSTLCRDGRGVAAIRDGRVTIYAGPTHVAAILAEADGQVWLGTFDGTLFRFAGQRFEAYPTPTTNPTAGINVIYRHADGALWLGTTRGLFREQAGAWSRPGEHDGLANDYVRTIVASPTDGSLWIGGTRLSHLESGRFTTYTQDQGLPRGPVRAIHIDADGTLWIGTYGGGLVRLREGRVTTYGLQGGVLDRAVHRIVEDAAGYLWMSGDRGIKRVSKPELNDIAAGRPAAPSVVHYDETDGMKSAEANGMAQPAGWSMRDGTIWFPTQGGIVRVDPRRTDAEVIVAPSSVIESTTVDGTSHAAAPNFTVAPGYRDIEIRYTAPAFGRPEQVQFRYRLDGHDTDWVEVGTRRVAHYANLRPGEYRFSVVARNSGGPWQARAATMAMVLRPYFYERRPFQVGLVGLSAAAIVALVRWRVSRLRHRAQLLEATVAERTAELAQQRDAVRAAHDELTRAHRELSVAKETAEQAHGQVLAVFNQLDIGVLVLSSAGVVTYASASAQKLLAKDPAALLGQSWFACLPIVDTDRAALRARVESRSPLSARMPVQMVLGGKRYWMEIDVRDEPHPGTGRLLYIYNATEVAAAPQGARIEGPHGLVGRSTAMHVVFKQIRDVGRVDTTVLIEGETGSGKELVARAIHRGSRRAAHPFIAVNAAGLTESLLASQLFGHRRGAFTGAVTDQMGMFEAANGGTLFLDEIGDISPSAQVGLLRALQEREITRIGESRTRPLDVRFLAATHRDLTREVADGNFREDLLYRIRVATIRVPPLRDRLDDVPLLVEAFLSQGARQSGRAIPEMSREAMGVLMRYTWPGNVRQLKSAIEQTLLRCSGNLIRLEDLPPEIWGNGDTARVAGASERERLVEALRRAEGNRAEAARILGIGRSTLYRKLAMHGLDGETE